MISASTAEPMNGSPSKKKWAILALSSITAIVTYMNWLNFTPLAIPIMNEYNLSHSEFGFLVTSAMALPIIAQFGSGILADKFGGERTMTLFLILVFIPAFFTGFSQNYGELMLSRLFIGIASATFVVGSKLIARYFDEKQMGFAQGVFGGSTIAGLALSAFIMPPIAELVGIRLSFIIASLSILPPLVIFIFLLSRGNTFQAHSPSKISWSVLKSPQTWYIAWLNFGFFGMYTSAISWLPAYFNEEFALNIIIAGGFSAIGMAIGAFIRPFGGFTGDRYRKRILLFIPVLFIAIFYMMIGLKLSIALSLVSFIFVSLFVMFGAGVLFRLPPLLFPKDVGTVIGFASTIGLLLGGFILPPIEGLSIDLTHSYTAVFYIVSIISVINIIATLKIKMK